MTAAYKKIHVVINPASGKDEPILNVLNDVFHQYNVDWNISVTKQYGDASRQAFDAIQAGAELVAGYGGDGTQHEIANAVLRAAAAGLTVPMGVLPGGTGNGFARELNVPSKLRPAVELLCTGHRVRKIDAAQVSDFGERKVEDAYFVQRLYVGVEPEQQTSREMKNKYGVLAYAVTAHQRVKSVPEVHYRATLDGADIEFVASKVYVVNSGMTGKGIAISHTYAIDDGLLDAFIMSKTTRATLFASADRLLNLHTQEAQKYYRQAREIRIDTDPDQPIWADGEYLGRTPVTVRVLPGALPVLVPA